MSAKKGFTLLEILLAVGAISILAGIVIVAINPGKQLANARNTTRLVDVNTIVDAIYQYTLNNDGVLPAGVASSTTYTMLGAAGSGCSIVCGAQADTNWNSNQSFADQTAADFSLGSMSNVTYDSANNGLKISSGGSGSFTSRAIDSVWVGTVWKTLAWSPSFPTNKELPNNGGSESGYSGGNANMAGNILLLHLNESAGTTNFADASGSNNSATCGGIICPVMGGSGKFNTAGSFDGLNDLIQVKYTPALKFTGGEMTISIWMKPDVAENNGSRIISRPWNGNGEYNYWIEYYQGGVTFCTGVLYSSFACVGAPRKPTVGAWNHIVATANSSTLKIFLNGAEENSKKYNVTNWMPSYGDENVALSIGTLYPYWAGWTGNPGFSFKGEIDEVVMFNRLLSPTEVLDFYKRGATRLKFRTRSGSSENLSGDFVGPNGSANSFYSELSNTALSPPSFSLSNVAANRYFQYKAILESDSNSLSPLLKTATVSADVPAPVDASSENTADACLDLSSTLVSGGYVTALPVDPKLGTADKTYYAVKAEANGKIKVKSCRSELSQDITAVR